jgi:molybdate transport system substrate-binding protein
VRVTVALVLAPLLAGCAGETKSADLTVSVAASLQAAMKELAGLFEQSHPNVRLKYNFGASGMLAQQIERGVPVDVFFSAAPGPMDQLERQGLIAPDSRRNVLRNQIVLIAPKDRSAPASFSDLRDPAVKLLALGNPESVPAGSYGREALQKMGLWEVLQPKLVLAQDVRQVLTYVETGNADAGIVYATDAGESDRVRVAARAPEDSHAPVIYPAAVVKDSRQPAAAREFVKFLITPPARAVFERHAFSVTSP